MSTRPRDNGGNVLATQFLRSATSIGANVEEAQCAESRKDFIHKMRIAQKEARECRYWLRLLREAHIIESSRSQDILQESDEILKVISAIIVNAKRNQEE